MTDAVYKREIEDGPVTIPEKHAAQEACVIATDAGQVLTYAQVTSDGTVPVDRIDGVAVTVVVPDMEAHE